VDSDDINNKTPQATETDHPDETQKTTETDHPDETQKPNTPTWIHALMRTCNCDIWNDECTEHYIREVFEQ
jgi:hypothetical protein